MPAADIDHQLDVLCGRTVDVVTREDLRARLAEGKKLRVKLGIDPTGPMLHLGHAVVLKKLRDFQDFGHEAILLVGDFTAQIGDPTGRENARPPRTKEQIEADMASYVEQAAAIIDVKAATIVYNSAWLAPMSLAQVTGLAGKVTVAQMLERDDFSKRYAAGQPIGLNEFLYPVSVAYDSVALEADVELGGTEQLYNLLLGRKLQGEHGQRPQVCITLPILEGTDGVRRMGKSLDNFIALRDAPNDMFGKVMSVPDAVLPRYWELAAFAARPEGMHNPRDEKMALAQRIVELYHGAEAARAARDNFERTVVRKETPADVPEHALAGSTSLCKLLVDLGWAASNREAQRLVEQGAIKLDGERMSDYRSSANGWHGKVLQKGNHQFVRLIAKQ